MKIKADKKILVKALSRVQGIVEKNSIKPITSNALIKAENNTLSVSATNLQIGISSKYKEITIEEEGSISVNARKIYEILRELPEGEVTLNEKENYWIEILCEKEVKFNIIGLPPEDFPSLFKENFDNYISLDIEKFINILNLISFSISKDENNININGTFLENIEGNLTRFVTTDGYRLSIMEENLNNNFNNNGFIIPYKATVEINKILLEKIEEKIFCFNYINNNLLIKIGEVDLFIRLIDKNFPDYKAILLGDGYKKLIVSVEKEKILKSLKRMSIISTENNRPVIFNFKENILEISTEDPDLGNVNEILKLKEKSKKDFSFCINCNYLIDIINALDDDILIEYNNEEENRPITVKPLNKKEKVKYIIMPMIIE